MRDARAQFGPVAEKYLSSAVHSNPASLSRLAELVQPKGGRLLDVATGAGHTAFTFAPFVDEVVVLDFTPEMLEVARSEARNRGLRLQPILGDAEVLPFASASFDGVTVRHAPHHFRNIGAFLAETLRVLRPQGWFLIVDTVGIDEDPAADDALDLIERLRDPSHERDLTPQSWLGLLNEAGFEVQHAETAPKRMSVPDWLDRMNVAEPVRSEVLALIHRAAGSLEKHLAPEGEGDGLTFTLHDGIFLVRPSPSTNRLLS